GVIVLVAEIPKALGNGFEARSLGLMIKRIVGIGAVDDLAEQEERVVVRQFVLLQDGLERTLLAVMTQFDTFHVIRNGIETLRFIHDLFGRDEEELRILVDEFLDQPWACDPIDFHVLAGNPFHLMSPFRPVVDVAGCSGLAVRGFAPLSSALTRSSWRTSTATRGLTPSRDAQTDRIG